MGKKVDLTNQHIKNFTVLEPTNKRYYGYIVWKCKCDCGKEFEAPYVNIKNGSITSCGCKYKLNINNFGKNNSSTGYNRTTYMTYDITGDYGIGYTRSGKKFLFDLEDYEKISKYSWHVCGKQLKSGAYKSANISYLIVSYILNIDNPTCIKKIIYKNGNNFDYRKNNIIIEFRKCSKYNNLIKR